MTSAEAVQLQERSCELGCKDGRIQAFFSGLEEATEHKPPGETRAVNVLLLGLGDLHHVLLTASRLWKQGGRPMQLHVSHGKLYTSPRFLVS